MDAIQSHSKVLAAVNQILKESLSFDQAILKILQTLCENIGWDVGAEWTLNPKTHKLHCLSLWRKPESGCPEFERLTRQMTFETGVGLPGRVLSTGAPAWIKEVTKDTNFPRIVVANKEGLLCGFGFPVWKNSEVVGVLEFFSRTVWKPDPELLKTMYSIGSQLGNFLQKDSRFQ